MQLQRTSLVKITKTGHRCVVTPDIIIVLPGDKVTIRNMTGDTAHAQIHNMNRVFSIPPGQSHLLTVPKVRPGIYPFAVFCNGSGVFSWTKSTQSTMSSMPIIIVPKL
jgi:hypothetical protein